jgi:hypothetical protein
MHRPLRGLLAAGLTAVVGLAALVGPAGAQSPTTSSTAPGASGRLRLADQTVWVAANGRYDLRLAVDRVEDPSAVEVTIRVYGAVQFRSGFVSSLDARGLRAAVAPAVTTPLGPVSDSSGTVGIAFRLGGETVDPAEHVLPPLGPGVYPVVATLRSTATGATVNRLVTHLVRVDPELEQPLEVAWVQRLGVQPAPASGAGSPADQRRIDALRRLTTALDETGLPFTLQLHGAGFAGLGDGALQALLPRLQATITRGQLLAAPYAPVDVSALVAAGLADELGDQREQGDQLVRQLTGTEGDPRTWAADTPVTAAAVDRLRQLGVTRLVVPETGLKALAGRLTGGATLTRPFALGDAGGGGLTAIASDPGTDRYFTEDDAVLGAHHLLADLAVVERDRPGTPRGVVIRPPASWPGDADFLAVIGAGLGTGAPALRAVTLERLLADVPPLTDGRRPVVREAPSLPTTALPGRAVIAARNAVRAVSEVAGVGSEPATTLRRLVLVGESSTLTTAERRTFLDEASAAARAVTDHIRVDADARYRLTAREGRIPVAVVNDNPFPVRVSLDLSAEKLEFTAAPGTERTRQRIADIAIPASGRRTLVVQVRVRTSGDFPLHATLRSPAGDVILARSRFAITSTAVSGVGAVLSVGALLFLAVWWFRHWRRARAAAVPGEAGADR